MRILSSRLSPLCGQRGMSDNHQVIEEPCEAKVSRTVLEPRQGGDSLSLGSALQATAFTITGDAVLTLNDAV